MSLVEAVVKMIWGTDEKCLRERREGERMIAEAEAKVDRLQRVLDEGPARNLDEALYQMTHRE